MLMNGFIIGIVEVVYRLLLLVVSIYITIYVLVDNSYTFMQFVLKHIHINGAGYSYDPNDSIYEIILYVTVLRHLPLCIIHMLIYVSPIMYKHEYNSLLIKIIYVICVVSLVHVFVFSLIVPIIVVIVTDIQYNIGQDYIIDVSIYMYIVKYVLILCILYIISMYVLYANKYNVSKSVSYYRRVFRLSLCLLYASSDDISIDMMMLVITAVVISIEACVISYIYRNRVNNIWGCSAIGSAIVLHAVGYEFESRHFQ